MKVLHSWLREFIPDLDTHALADPDALGNVMTSIGLCCEEVVRIGGGLDGIIVAKVLELSPHPDADRIQLVQVDVGDGAALQICCGAFNMAVGDLVPLATLGTTMPSGMEIARRKLRGEYSNGMLCSAAELELNEDSSGIFILSPDLTLGSALTDALGIEPDALYDLDLTPNRPDALSVLGVARDVAAQLGLAFVVPTVELPTTGAAATTLVAVNVGDPVLCGRFAGLVLSDISVGTSPDWMARRLILCGMRPVNSIVDISNYVMLEYGQPSHTFDLDTITGATLGIRRAVDSESVVTLDGQTRSLVVGDGVIVDGDDTPIGIAGVMGGASTEISQSTSRVLLEAAWWDPVSIGATSKRLGLRSEASSRFEKGADPEIAWAAARRFAQLAIEQGAALHPGELRYDDGVVPDRSPVLVRPSRVNAVLGSSISTEQMVAYLTPIGFDSVARGDDLLVSLPSWRPDSTGEIDVVEEIARHHGYDRLGKTVPSSGARRGGLTQIQKDRRVLALTLRSLGASEAKPMPFFAPGDLERFGVRADAISVTNPLVAEESVLRTSTLPGLVRAVATNAAHRNTGVSLFEMGHCFAVADGPDTHVEWDELGVVLAGRAASVAVEWAIAVIASIGRPAPVFTSAHVGGLHPTRAAVIDIDGTVVGEVGEVDPGVTEDRGVTERVAWVRIDLDALFGIERIVAEERPVSRFPSSDLDLALVVADSVPAHEVVACLAEAHPLVVDARLFDVFRSESLGEGRRSLACSVRLQALDRTLTDADVTAARAALLAAAGRLGAELRA